jgi:hypothetical protein
MSLRWSYRRGRQGAVKASTDGNRTWAKIVRSPGHLIGRDGFPPHLTAAAEPACADNSNKPYATGASSLLIPHLTFSAPVVRQAIG